MDGLGLPQYSWSLTPCDHSRKQPVLVKTTLSETQFELWLKLGNEKLSQATAPVSNHDCFIGITKLDFYFVSIY